MPLAAVVYEDCEARSPSPSVAVSYVQDFVIVAASWVALLYWASFRPRMS